MTDSERCGSRCGRLTLERTKVLNNHGPIESLACAMPWNPRHLSSRCSVARYSRKFSQGNYDGSFERNRGSHRFQRVFEKSPFCHISPTMFPHSSFQTAGANPGPPLTGWTWLASVMTAVQRVCYALEAAVRSLFRAGFHCQIEISAIRDALLTQLGGPWPFNANWSFLSGELTRNELTAGL